MKFVLNPFPGYIDHPVKVQVGYRCAVSRFGGDKQLMERRHDGRRLATKPAWVNRDITPGMNGEALFCCDLLDCCPVGGLTVRIGGHECYAGCVGTGLGQVWEFRAEEAVWDLDQDARSVAGGWFSVGGPSVLEAGKSMQALEHNVIALATVQIGDEGNAAGVMFECGVVKALGFWRDVHSVSMVVRAPIAGTRPCRPSFHSG